MSLVDPTLAIRARLSGLADDPFIRVKERSNEEILQWLRAIYDNHYYTHDATFSKQQSFYQLYRGVSVEDHLQNYYSLMGIDYKINKRGQKLLVNYIQKMINEEVATVMRYNRDISALPGTEDFQDRIEAEIVQEVISSLRSKQRRYRFLANASKKARIHGCAIVYITWDPNAGKQISTKKEGDVFEVEFDNDKTVKLKRPLYEGEVKVSLLDPKDVGFQPFKTISSVDWCFIREFTPVDELIADYYGLLSEAEIDLLRRTALSFDGQDMFADYGSANLRNHVKTITFYHRKTPYVPNGAKIVFTLDPDIILQQEDIEEEMVEYGTNTPGLPIEILYDEEVDDCIYGSSRIEGLIPLQGELRNVYTSIARNVRIGSIPRIVAPHNSIKSSKGRADTPVLFYKGGIPPELKSFSMVTPEVFGFKDMIKEEMREVYRSKPAVTDLGSNIRSAGQMQIIEADQEESEAVMAEEFRTFILNIERRCLDVISRHYTKSDRRFYETRGAPGKWMVKKIDVKSLNKPWQLEIQLADDLPRRKDRRMQTVMEMSQIWPSLFPPEAVADMFRMGDSDKFMSAGTVAYRSAEFENSKFRAGEKTPPPKMYDDHVIHWITHDKQLQSPELQEWPEERIEALVDHQRATEMLLIDQALQSPMLMQAIQTQLKGFPKIYVANPPPSLLATSGPVDPSMGGVPPVSAEGGAPTLGDETGDVNILGGPGENMPEVTQGRAQDGQFGAKINPVG